MVEGARFSPDGNVIATGCSDGFIRIWSAGFGELIATIDRRINDDSFLEHVLFFAGWKKLAAVVTDGIMLYETANWRPLRLLDGSGEISAGRGKSEPAACLFS